MFVSGNWPVLISAKLWFEIAPQMSPPADRRSCEAGFRRSQSGAKLLFSVHDRVTLKGENGPPLPGARRVGFELAQLFDTPAPSRYLPMLALTAVLPLPNTSHDAPTRGVMSLYELTPSVSGMLIATGRNLVGPSVCAGNQLVDRSKRSAPCTVSRLRVHCSCTKNACQPPSPLFCHGDTSSVS